MLGQQANKWALVVKEERGLWGAKCFKTDEVEWGKDTLHDLILRGREGRWSGVERCEQNKHGVERRPQPSILLCRGLCRVKVTLPSSGERMVWLVRSPEKTDSLGHEVLVQGRNPRRPT